MSGGRQTNVRRKETDDYRPGRRELGDVVMAEEIAPSDVVTLKKSCGDCKERETIIGYRLRPSY